MPQHTPDPGRHALAANPFFATPQQRLALARERYFEQGVRPTGLVGEAVIQSWARCLQQHREPGYTPAFNMVTAGRVQSVMRRNRALLDAAGSDMRQLQTTLAGTGGTAILTDRDGVVVSSTFTGERVQDKLMALSARVGVDLSEAAVGTNAPGLTARTGQASVVMGGEHFFGSVQVMHCAAAPIRDVHGDLAGVLDLSSEHVPFGFDAASVVALYATSIENRLLCAQSGGQLVVKIALAPSLLDTPMEGLLGVDGGGRIAWANGSAARLLALTPHWRSEQGTESLLGLGLGALLDASRAAAPRPIRLPSGLTVWLASRAPAQDGLATPVHGLGATTPAPPPVAAAAALPAGTLREVDRELVARTLQACDGNVSATARQLGVSRGLIYRHLHAKPA